MARETESATRSIRVTRETYQAAAWQAYASGAAAPDPSVLSNELLRAFMTRRYNDTAFLLPLAACQLIDLEWNRRRVSRNLIDDLLAFAAVALPALSGIVISWVLLFH
jgi:hypothetical protein